MSIFFLIFIILFLSYSKTPQAVITGIIFILLLLGNRFNQNYSGSDFSHFYLPIYEGKIEPQEIGYKYLSMIINNITNNDPFTGLMVENFIVAMMYCTLIYVFNKILRTISQGKIPNHVIFLLNFLILFYIMEYYISGTRNFLAVTFYIIAVLFFIGNKIKTSLLFAIFGALFHTIGIYLLIIHLIILFLFNKVKKTLHKPLESKILNWNFYKKNNIIFVSIFVFILLVFKNQFNEFVELFSFSPFIYQKFFTYTSIIKEVNDNIRITSYLRFIIFISIVIIIYKMPIIKYSNNINLINIIAKIKIISLVIMTNLIFFLSLNYINIIPYGTLTRFFSTFQDIILVLLLIYATLTKIKLNYIFLGLLLALSFYSLIAGILNYNNMNSIENFLFFSYPGIL